MFLWCQIIESLNLAKAKICKLFHFQNILMLYKEKMTQFNYYMSYWYIMGCVFLGGNVECINSSVVSCL